MLDMKLLKAMPPRTMFSSNVVTEPRLYKGGDVRWVAVRGGIADWAIYYHLAKYSMNYVRDYGDKCFTRELIRELVPCTDEAFKAYRY